MRGLGICVTMKGGEDCKHVVEPRKNGAPYERWEMKCAVQGIAVYL